MTTGPGDEVRIRGIGAGGVGVGELPDGRVVFVPRTAPGDLVRVDLAQSKQRWARGVAREILEEGEGRRPAPCPRYQECHGCSLQHLEYPHQLRWKGRIVGDALRQIGGLQAMDPGIRASPRETGYRNKATMTLRRLKGGRVVAGFHQLSDRRRILDLGPECLLLAPELAELWGNLRGAWGPGARMLPEGPELRLTLRIGLDRGALLIRGGRGDGRPDRLLEAVPGLASIWRERRGGGARHVGGDRSMEVSWMGESLELEGGAFLQVNPEAGELLHRHVLEEAGEVGGQRVVDAYCGTGILGRGFARRGARVVGIEADPLGVAEALREPLEGFDVVLGRVEELLEGVLPADLVVLNPPRAGLHVRVTEALAGGLARKILYISCDPGTLARDLARLGDGFEIQGTRCFDLFPQTGHVETVVSLRGQSA